MNPDGSGPDREPRSREKADAPPAPPPAVQQLELLIPLVESAAKASVRAAQWVFVPATLVLLLGAGMIGYVMLNSGAFTQTELQTVVIVGALLAVVGLIAVPSSFVGAGKATATPAVRGATEQLRALISSPSGDAGSAPTSSGVGTGTHAVAVLGTQ